MMGKRMGRLAALLMAVLVLTGAAAAEGREILLPDGVHRLTVPSEMSWQEPAADEVDLKGILLMPPELEMLIFAYDAGGLNVRETAEVLAEAGRQAEVREIAGTEFLVYQDTDEADGASCVGYSYIENGMMVEVSFFYASQAAMDLTRTIMESFQ